MDRNVTTLIACVLLVGCSKPDGTARGGVAAHERPQFGIHGDEAGSGADGMSHKGAAKGREDPRARTEGAAAAAPSGPGGGAAPPVDWFKGVYADALALARAEGRELMVDVGAAWCPPCQELHEGALKDPDIRGLLARSFISISIDADVAEGPQLVEWYGVGAFPTLLRVDGLGNELSRLVEEIDAAQVSAWLEASAPSKADTLALARARHQEAPASSSRRRARAMAEVSYGDARRVDELLKEEGGAADYVRDVIAHWGRGAECGPTTRASLRRRATTPGGTHHRDAITRLAALLADSSPAEASALLASLAATHGAQAAWACAQLRLPAQPCLGWIPAATGDALGDAALAALEARLAAQAGDGARAARSMARARKLAPNVAAYRAEDAAKVGAR